MLLESDNLLGSNSLSPFVKRVQFCESNFGNPVHYLWVMLKTVQICKFLLKKQILTKRFNSWSHIQKEWFNSVSHIQKNIQFFVLYFLSSISTLSHVKCSILWVILKRKAQFFESCSKQGQSFVSDIVEKGLKIRKKSNPLSYKEKKVQFFGSCKTESSIHRVNCWKGSILRVRFSFKNFNSQSHIFPRTINSIHSLSHAFCKQEENLWVIL